MLFGVIGNGFVGNATQLISSETNQCLVYDIDPQKCVPLGLQLDDLRECKIIFICVPTPAGEGGSCDTSIVENCVDQVKQHINPEETFIVCRSTVIMGTCDKLGVYHMPEFLTEKNWREDFLECETWIFGYPEYNPDFESAMRELFDNSPVAGELHFVPNKCSEMVKYARNTFLATKISFCNELNTICETAEIDYSIVRDLFSADPRIGSSHTMVPGPDGNYGFGGHCLPKDLAAIVSYMDDEKIDSYILEKVQDYNLHINNKS